MRGISTLSKGTTYKLAMISSTLLAVPLSILILWLILEKLSATLIVKASMLIVIGCVCLALSQIVRKGAKEGIREVTKWLPSVHHSRHAD